MDVKRVTLLSIVAMTCFLNGCAAVRMAGRMNQGVGDAMVKSADEEETKRAAVAGKKEEIQMREYEERERIKTQGLAKKEGVESQSVGESREERKSSLPATGGSSPQSMTIAQIQQRLSQLGYKPGPADGKMGKNTIEALKKFQQDNNLTNTGRADNETVAKLLQKREAKAEPSSPQSPLSTEVPQKSTPAKVRSATDL